MGEAAAIAAIACFGDDLATSFGRHIRRLEGTAAAIAAANPLLLLHFRCCTNSVCAGEAVLAYPVADLAYPVAVLAFRHLDCRRTTTSCCCILAGEVGLCPTMVRTSSETDSQAAGHPDCCIAGFVGAGLGYCIAGVEEVPDCRTDSKVVVRRHNC